MDPTSIPPRLDHLRESDRAHFKTHLPVTPQDSTSLVGKVFLHSLPESASPHKPTTTTATDASPAAAAVTSTDGDATAKANHHHVHQQRPHHHSQFFVKPASLPSMLEAQPMTAASIAPHASPQNRSSAHQPTVPSVHSQDSNMSVESDNVFTPPASQGDVSGLHTNGHSSSQESQLLQLSHVAAAQDKLDEGDAMATSRKRMADGVVKENASPLSSDLKTRLSYAMLKVNHGWQYHTIDEVESMASQAASPTSSQSTLHGRQESSASPRSNMARYAPASAATTASSNPSPTTYESFWKDGQRSNQTSASPPASTSNAPTLAPPAPIQPSRPASHNLRMNSNPRYTPTPLSYSHSASPHTPGQQQAVNATPNQRLGRAPPIDPILFSPHQNVREQDAIESLIFMSSPGNSANMKHNYSQSVASSLPGRHALPNSQPRKGLPTQRPLPQKRVGFEKSPGSMTVVSDMDIDVDSPQSRGHMRRRINGSASFSGSTLRPQMSLPAALGSTSRPRPRLADADIDRMIDQAAQAGESSDDDEGEIQIPSRNRTEGAVGV
ncbi:hypothetical protein C8035_v012363 [Colletotrichum spinosum]|uniref:Uncharacterized protein n=1 Tax=Colletotrichum spinosum TaxID=1347390 RepID=A0A4R8Q245_9PEZI|nr:hypothetical protein C8035_v012363 [Colletotrichum spinosum]